MVHAQEQTQTPDTPPGIAAPEKVKKFMAFDGCRLVVVAQYVLILIARSSWGTENLTVC